MQKSTLPWGWAVIVLVVSTIAPSSASARPEFLQAFLEEYPAVVGTRLESCNVCHTSPPLRNDYGFDFNLAGRRFAPIESTDSDKDGADNLTEITGLTFPGDPLDGPNASPTETATSPPTHTPVPTHTPAATSTPKPTNTRLPTPTIVPGPCYGDCNEDGVVAINELVLAVRIALGSASADECLLADDNGDGEVSINELLRAVNRALFGCPAQ